MSPDAPPGSSPPPRPSEASEAQSQTQRITPDELAKMVAATTPSAPSPDGGQGLRKKLLVAVLIAAVGVGASIMSCVGQSFSYRQAHALEGIEQQLKEIRAGCGTTSPLGGVR